MSCKRNREPIFTSRPNWNESLLRKNVTRAFVSNLSRGKWERERKGKERKIDREEMAESSGRSRLGTNSIGIATGGGTNKLDRDTERGGRKMAWKFGGD